MNKQPSKEEIVEVWETYEKRDGVVYYGWRLGRTKEWNWKPTAAKQVPWSILKKMSTKEYKLKYLQTNMDEEK